MTPWTANPQRVGVPLSHGDIGLTAARPGHSVGCTPVAEDVPPSTESQPYQALYRRYRPRRFADVRGQEPVSRALLNAVREDRVAHAYLFSGPRGTGKTSTARILAMALNCEAPVGGEPDGTCASCTAIRAGSSMDVFELDAASNRKLDEMRDLLSRVALGTPGRWKVYIIDEVHQLTSDAASALLKTLEEPPSHVVFVLATTDPQKVLPTILSRTQHFEFRLLDGDLLTDLLSGINQDAGLGLTPEAVELAVRRGRGSARDAESALEQLAAAGGGEDDGSPLVELVDALAERDVSRTLQAVASAIAAGREPRRLGSDLVEHLRNAFLAVQAPSLVLLPGAAHGQACRDRKPDGPAVPRPVDGSGGPGHGRHARLRRPQSHARGCAHPPRLSSCQHEPDRAAGTRGAARKGYLGKGAGGSHTWRGGAAASGYPSRPGRARARCGPGSWPTGTGSPSGWPGPGQGRARGVPARRLSVSEPSVSEPPVSEPRQRAPHGERLDRRTPHRQRSPRSAGALADRQPDCPSASATSAASDAHAGSLPSRDELTKVWGDTLLDKLSRPAKVYMASGRFVEVKDGAAVFALPDAGLLARANNFLNETEGALTAHFGRRVPLRLVLDSGAAAAAPPGGATPGDEETYDLDDVADIVDAPTVPALPVGGTHTPGVPRLCPRRLSQCTQPPSKT